ncbi:6511_t:CDS:2, partial [Paraglomus occultum]
MSNMTDIDIEAGISEDILTVFEPNEQSKYIKPVGSDIIEKEVKVEHSLDSSSTNEVRMTDEQLETQFNYTLFKKSISISNKAALNTTHLQHITVGYPYYCFTSIFVFELTFRTFYLLIWFNNKRICLESFVDRLVTFIGGLEYLALISFNRMSPSWSMSRALSCILGHIIIGILLDAIFLAQIYSGSKESNDFRYGTLEEKCRRSVKRRVPEGEKDSENESECDEGDDEIGSPLPFNIDELDGLVQVQAKPANLKALRTIEQIAKRLAENIISKSHESMDMDDAKTYTSDLLMQLQPQVPGVGASAEWNILWLLFS